MMSLLECVLDDGRSLALYLDEVPLMPSSSYASTLLLYTATIHYILPLIIKTDLEKAFDRVPKNGGR